MVVNISEVIKCGDKLYYDINPKSKMDVPSYFYQRLEKEWVIWKEEGNNIPFYDFCKKRIK